MKNTTVYPQWVQVQRKRGTTVMICGLASKTKQETFRAGYIINAELALNS